jgi:hypothetical protein
MCIPLIVARQRLGRHVPGETNTRNNTTKNYWRFRFLYGPCRIKGESVGLSVYPLLNPSHKEARYIHSETLNFFYKYSLIQFLI